MKKIIPDTKKRIYLVICGVLAILVGFHLFPKSIFEGDVEIIPILFSSFFFVTGISAIYFGAFYQIKIDNHGVLMGSSVSFNKISKEQIKGYFLAEETTKKGKQFDILVLCLLDGKKRRFGSEYLGDNFKELEKEISERYRLLPLTDKNQYFLEKKIKGFKWASYIGMSIFVLGTYLLISTINLNSDFIEIKGSLKEQPEFEYGKYDRLSRVNIKLKEFPNLTFSQVKNVYQFENWVNMVQRDEEIIIEISEESYRKKIQNTIEPNKVIVNYDGNTIEIKRLRRQNNQYVYKENRFEKILLPTFIMIFGFCCFIYFFRKEKTGYNNA